MNEVLNTGLTLWQFITSLLVLVAGFVAIRVSLKFDLNKYLESRQKNLDSRIMNACSHMELSLTDDDKIQIKSLLISPPGTLQWQCQRCGLVRHHVDEDEIKRMADYYVNHPKEYQKKNKLFTKLLKKSGRL